MSTRILAFSSSRVGGSGYLETAVPAIKSFLGNEPLDIAFVPFASVDGEYEAYGDKVRDGLKSLPHTIRVVQPDTAKATIERCDVIMIGGGNTFKLLHDLYHFEIFEVIRNKVQAGTPYIGWSAGSNITGLTIGTTNDMPIIEPQSFKAFGFFPFQINPHYLNVKPEGHNGETRDERLIEFMKINPALPIIGLPEGTALQLQDGMLSLVGECSAVLFRSESDNPIKNVIAADDDLSLLLQR